MVKFHLTQRLPPTVSPIEKMEEKVRSFYHSDKNTPILGEIVSKYVELNDGVPDCSEKTALIRRFGSESIENQYPNLVGDWADELVGKMYPRFDRGILKDWLSKVKNTLEFLEFPLCVNPSNVEKGAVVNGSVHGDEIKDVPVLDLPKEEIEQVKKDKAELYRQKAKGSARGAKGNGKKKNPKGKRGNRDSKILSAKRDKPV